MAYEQRDLSGSLFKNDRRESDNQPNAKGSALIDGVEYWVSAWTRRDKNGNPWQSLAFTRKEAKAPADDRARHAASMRAQAPSAEAFDDDVPF